MQPEHATPTDPRSRLTFEEARTLARNLSTPTTCGGQPASAGGVFHVHLDADSTYSVSGDFLDAERYSASHVETWDGGALVPLDADLSAYFAPRERTRVQRFRTFGERYPTLATYTRRAAQAFALIHVEAERVPDSILRYGWKSKVEPEALALRAVQEPVHASGSAPRYRWHVLEHADIVDRNTREEIEAEERNPHAERVHVVVVPRDTSRTPYVLAPCTRTRALDVLATFHAPEALAWDFLPASIVDAPEGATLETYTLREPVDTYPAGCVVFGVWDARYLDDTDDARPMLRVLAGADRDTGTMLRPYSAPGIVRVATLDDVQPLGVDAKVARAWDFEDGGVDSASYFRGAGCEDFDDVATGTGNTAREALDDALDALASNGWDVGACALAIVHDNPGAWDRDMVGEALAEHVEPATLRVRFLASCGMDTAEGGTFDDVDDALACVRRILDARRALDGFEVDTFEEGADLDAGFADNLRAALERHDDGESWTWEARAPEDCALIPDTDGTLHLEIVRGVPLDEIAEDSDLSYFVSVRVREHTGDVCETCERVPVREGFSVCEDCARANPNPVPGV